MKRLWDYHAAILREECELHKSRILNLLDRWKCKSQEGLLPLPEHVGIFEQLKQVNDENRRKLKFFADSRLKRWETRRSFEDILEMTDNLKDMHLALAVAERCYWQRLEGYEAAAVDAVRRGTFSEAGTIQQICNAADFLCQAYWDKVFGKNKSNWKGIVTFGQFHEFRNWRSFIFAPDYVKIRNFSMWVYFAHEVMHRAVDVLLSNPKFQEIHHDLVHIFSAIPREIKFADDNYLATETICDVMTTLIAGETYIKTLSSLKYYPTVVMASKRGFKQRRIRYPMLLRTIISGWAIIIAWGFNQSAKPKFSIQELIRSVWNEDQMERERVVFFLKDRPSLLRKLKPEKLTLKDTYRRLRKVYDYERVMKTLLIPPVLSGILKMDIIPRIKKFVKDDCYHTKPSHCFLRFIKNRRWNRSHIMQVNPRCCERTQSAPDVQKRISRQRKRTREITAALIRNQLVVDSNPSDIITGLNLLSKGQMARGRPDYHENAAMISISLQTEYRRRRLDLSFGKGC